MAKKAYPLRINEEVLSAMQHWAEDELRSVNAQIEYVLREALRNSGRAKPPKVVAQEISASEELSVSQESALLQEPPEAK